MVALALESVQESSTTTERRQSSRRPVQLQLACRRLSYSLEARRQPDILLDSTDLSDTGLGAISDIPLAPGEQVVIRFSPMSITHRRTVWGVVQRCEPAGQGYRVGLSFGAAANAA